MTSCQGILGYHHIRGGDTSLFRGINPRSHPTTAPPPGRLATQRPTGFSSWNPNPTLLLLCLSGRFRSLEGVYVHAFGDGSITILCRGRKEVRHAVRGSEPKA